jgi:hypothetical protein
MAMKAGHGPRGHEKWRPLLQRGIDTASDLTDALAQKLSAAADPRARRLRQRRWALRGAAFFGFACAFWILVTALLASWSTPVWALLITGLIAAGAAFPATLLFLRYLWLKRSPLPDRRPVSARRLPAAGSAARHPMSALAASERGLFSLLGVMERGNMLPASEIRELTDVANQTAATMTATAAEVVSMERTVNLTPHSRSYLLPTIDAFTAQLHNGVQQYNEMVTAAAQLVSSANAGSMSSSPMSRQRYRDELVNATDRMVGWAQAFDELGRLRRA